MLQALSLTIRLHDLFGMHLSRMSWVETRLKGNKSFWYLMLQVGEGVVMLTHAFDAMYTGLFHLCN